jgi:hypothetical protein
VSSSGGGVCCDSRWPSGLGELEDGVCADRVVIVDGGRAIDPDSAFQGDQGDALTEQMLYPIGRWWRRREI